MNTITHRSHALLLSLCAFVGLAFAQPANAQQVAALELDDEAAVCVDEQLASELEGEASLDDEAEAFEAYDISCQIQCYRDFPCVYEWQQACWNARHACLANC